MSLYWCVQCRGRVQHISTLLWQEVGRIVWVWAFWLVSFKEENTGLNYLKQKHKHNDKVEVIPLAKFLQEKDCGDSSKTVCGVT